MKKENNKQEKKEKVVTLEFLLVEVVLTINYDCAWPSCKQSDLVEPKPMHYAWRTGIFNYLSVRRMLWGYIKLLSMPVGSNERRVRWT